MISDVMQSISGIGVYPTFSLLMFIAAFALVIWKVLAMDKQEAVRFSHLPLDDCESHMVPDEQKKRSKRPDED